MRFESVQENKDNEIPAAETPAIEKAATGRPQEQEREAPPEKDGLAARLKRAARLGEIKEKLGFGEKTIEKIPATPENVAEFLKAIGPEYKRFLMEEFKPKNKWFAESGEDEYPYECSRSSEILGNMLAEIFDLKLGGASTNRIDLVDGAYFSTGLWHHHRWARLEIDGKPYYVDALLLAQEYYFERRCEAKGRFDDLTGKKYYKSCKDYFEQTLDQAPSEIIFMPYNKAVDGAGIKEHKGMSDYNRAEYDKLTASSDELSRKEKDKLIMDYQFAHPNERDQEAIDNFRKDRKLNAIIKKVRTQINEKQGLAKSNVPHEIGSPGAAV